MSRRLLKAGEAIREVVSMAILTEMRDPRVQNVTVVGVDVAPDMRSAKVAVSIMGSEKNQELVLRGLQHAAGFLQSRIADRIDTRYIPKLTFVMDKGIKHSLEIQRILKEVLPQDEKPVNDELDNELEDEFNDEIIDDVAEDHDTDDQESDDSNASEK
jgi:ribosome-binding factor A